MSGQGPGRDIVLGAIEGGISATFQAMGSPCELLCESDSRDHVRRVADAVAAEAWRIEDKFSRYIAGNVIDQINNAGGAPVAIDDETARLIDFSHTLYELSEGRFDITSGVLRRVWTFDGSDRLPTEADVEEVLQYVGWQRVERDDDSISLPAGTEIDLGGVGKEYAVDRATSIAREMIDASCLVNFGGDLAVTCAPARRHAWQVGIDTPGDDATVIGLATGALATSGDARRFLLKDGVRYGHILDPTTGWPVQGAPESITVAADTCVQAGMLCTLAMLQGTGAREFLETQGVDYWIANRSGD